MSGVEETLAGFARTLARCRHALVFWGAMPEDWVSELVSLDGLADHAAAFCIQFGKSIQRGAREPARGHRSSNNFKILSYKIKVQHFLECRGMSMVGRVAVAGQCGSL